MKQADKLAHVIHFLPRQKGLVIKHRGGEGVKWDLGCTVKVLGPLTYLVKVYGKVDKRPVNQLTDTECVRRHPI